MYKQNTNSLRITEEFTSSTESTSSSSKKSEAEEIQQQFRWRDIVILTICRILMDPLAVNFTLLPSVRFLKSICITAVLSVN